MNLSPIVSKTIPEFVNDDYPLFVQFLKTYYKWLDITQISSIENVVDIDTTIDSFVKYFRQELDIFGIKYQYVDERIYLKYVKHFFLAKGSEAAYWFLFRILFNSDSAILRPWDSVFIPSNAKWIQDITIFVRIDKGNGNNLKQNKVIIIGDDDKEYQGRVIDAIEIRYNVFELYLDKILTGNISIGNIVISEDKKTKGRLLSTITKVNIQSSGRNFNVGEIYDIVTQNGYGSKFIVREVNENGGITKLELISFGLGYEHQFMQTVYPITVDERILPYYNVILSHANIPAVITNENTDLYEITSSNTQFKLPYAITYFAEDYIDPGFEFITEDITPVSITERFDIAQIVNPITFGYNSGDIVNEISDFGEIVKHNYGISPTDYFEDLTYVGNKVGQFDNKVTAEIKEQDAAILFCYTDYLVKYPGYYSDLYDTLGQNLYIQDSYYYQVYSYVTSVNKPLKSYHTLINNIIHPIGNKVFGNYVPTSLANLSLSITNTLDVIYPDSYINDPVIAIDDFSYIFDHTLATNDVNVNDYYILILNGLATLPTDDVVVDEEDNKSLIKVVNDEYAQTDDFKYTRIYTDSAIASEEIAFEITKIRSDSYVFGDVCGKSRIISITIEDTVDSSDEDFLAAEGLLPTDNAIAVDNGIICGTIIRINETLTMIESTALYYGELYVDQMPQYWDATYYVNEQIF